MYLTTKILHLILSWYLPRYVTHCSYKRHHLPNTVLSQAPQEQLRPHLRNRRLRAAIKLTTRISLLNRIRYETRMTWTHAGLLLCNWQLDSVKRDNYFAYTDVDSKGWRNFQKKKKQATSKPVTLREKCRPWWPKSLAFDYWFCDLLHWLLGVILNVNANYQSTMCLKVQLYLSIMLLRNILKSSQYHLI